MSEIRSILLDSGIEADRRSVYKAINVLNEHGYEIFYEARGGKQGYWIRHPLTLAEALFICDSIQTSSALSETTASAFSRRIASLLSVHEQKKLPDTVSSLARTDNDHVLRLIEILLNAIADRNPVEFRYYDIGVTKKFLRREWDRAMEGVVTPNCREQCSGCGAGSYGCGICPTNTNPLEPAARGFRGAAAKKMPETVRPDPGDTFAGEVRA